MRWTKPAMWCFRSCRGRRCRWRSDRSCRSHRRNRNRGNSRPLRSCSSRAKTCARGGRGGATPTRSTRPPTTSAWRRWRAAYWTWRTFRRTARRRRTTSSSHPSVPPGCCSWTPSLVPRALAQTPCGSPPRQPSSSGRDCWIRPDINRVWFVKLRYSFIHCSKLRPRSKIYHPRNILVRPYF